MKKCYLSTALLYFLIILPHSREPFFPYITGDGFRAISDHLFDETVNRNLFSHEKVRQGDIIFVKTDYLDQFFAAIHPKINVRYIIISHNSDYGITEKYAKYLNDEKVIAWFAQNVEYKHDKLIPIPIGLENRYNAYGNLSVIDSARKRLAYNKKTIPLYMNFSPGTNLKERSVVYNLFAQKSFCFVRGRTDYNQYLTDLSQAQFVLSPRGNGLDCHRTWESLYMGTIPVVRSSAMDSVFTNLPVLIIDNWNQITSDFLQNQYVKIAANPYDLSQLYMAHWIHLINGHRAK